MNTHARTAVSLRSTSGTSMSTPLTQNTAPVIEHRCLFSHDIRRKAKRWQDGILRFHTFNKRIMVYDFPARNYIGDTHWREECPVQDGDELQLDRPVLVQVCDQVGSIEQDLTELLESRRKKHVAAETPALKRTLLAPQQACRSPLDDRADLPPPPPPPQLQPKSLNALLGRSANRPGKAALPTKSPYAIREEAQPLGTRDGRPFKRTRLENPVLSRQREDAQNDIVTEHHTAYEGLPRRHAHLSSSELAPGHQGQLCGRSKVSISETPTATSSAVAEVCAKPNTLLVNTAGSGVSSTRQKHRQSRDAKAQGRPDIDKSRNEKMLSRRCNSPQLSSSPRERSCDPPHRSSSSPPTLAEHQTARTRQLQKPRAKLRMASHKPRRKLMYRDLLPPDESGTSYGSPNTVCRSPTAARTGAQDPTMDNTVDIVLLPVDESQTEAHLPRSKPGPSHLSDESITDTEAQRVAKRIRGTASTYDQPAGHKRATHVDRETSEDSSAKHHTNASLQKVDEILATQHFGNEASKQIRQQPPRHLQKDRDLSPSISMIESTPIADTVASPDHHKEKVKSPILISSPEVEAGAVRLFVRKHEGAATTDADYGATLDSPSPEKGKCADHAEADETPAHIGESLTNANPVRPRRQAAATSLAGGPPQLRSATSLPNFVPVRPTGRARSPLKASMSENSIDAVDARRGQGAQPPQPGPCRALVAEPWSREAWDLFGCTRDGLQVSYGDFCRKEGVV